MLHEAQAIIHLDNIRANLQVARDTSPGKKAMAVIKGNAYGHGAVEVARTLTHADSFAVAMLKEAVELRQAGISSPICLLEGVLDESELLVAAEYDIDLVIHAPHQLPLLDKALARPVWIKVDTGMGRLGFPPDEVAAVVQRLSGQRILGLMTHLASADEEGAEPTEAQIRRLSPFVGNYPLNISNSAGILNQSIECTNWIRPGVMLYGASPLESQALVPALRPGMTFRAPVIAVREALTGTTVGYGRTWAATADCRLAVVAAGYADGYPREIGPDTPVLIHGKLRRIVGRVSMDMLSVMLEPEDEVAPGDPVTLWGEGLPIETIARAAGTIAYTLMTGVTGRVSRIYS